MDKQTQILNSYDRLRDEILQADSLNYQTLGIVSGAVAAILTIGFTQPDPVVRTFIFLGVYVVTIPGYRLLQGNRRRTWRITTYIRAFLEPELEQVKWETRLAIQAKRRARKGGQLFSSLVTTNEWLIMLMFNLVAGIAAAILGLLQMNIEFTGKAIGITVIIIWNLYLAITTLLQEKNLRRGGKIEENYYQSWLEIAKEASKNR